MSKEPNYFRYVVAQYYHSRREERLNVGVIVHDPLRAVVRSHFDLTDATRRIKTAFPDVDAKGLRLFLKDLGEAVMTSPELNAVIDQPTALTSFGEGWRNAIQFTPVRSVPAENITMAVDLLAALYVAPVPEQLRQAPAVTGVPFARKRTQDALRKVLHLEEGVGYRDFREVRERSVFGKTSRTPIEFPFFVYDKFVIDTLSFRGDSFPAKQNIAAGFVDRVEMLRDLPGYELSPCVTYVADEERRDDATSLVLHILDKTGLPEQSIVDADHAEDLAIYIRDHRDVA